ncbi:hypothetical protein HYV31_03115 [candidate division WWE3 bacterium]|nr:hypothetical protein [candidate division WWE3 bacterium]
MFIPLVQKITKRNNVLVERALPKKGELDAPIGTKVEPFTRVGIAKVSYGRLPLASSLKIVRGKSVGSYFYTGEVLGILTGKKIIAPFDGVLQKIPNGFMFEQEERDFWLLAGVWGEVIDYVDKYSVILKTQTTDIHLAACTQNSCDGELIVFPNPSELLEMHYLERFSKDSFGKIVYTGNYVNSMMVAKAIELGVAGIIAGSAERDAFSLAKRNGVFLGSISGFGKIPTPTNVYAFLKDISNRYVFLQGSRQLLRIPVSSEFSEAEVSPDLFSGTLCELKCDLSVQVFEEPYFGWVGKVSSVTDDDVYVILDDVKDPVKIKIPNLVALE